MRGLTPTVQPDDVRLSDFDLNEIIDWIVEQKLSQQQSSKLRTLGNAIRKEPLSIGSLLYTMKVECILEKIDNIPIGDIEIFCHKYK